MNNFIHSVEIETPQIFSTKQSQFTYQSLSNLLLYYHDEITITYDMINITKSNIYISVLVAQ